MKFTYRNRKFRSKGYYVDTVGKNTNAIKEYIAKRLSGDRKIGQMSFLDPYRLSVKINESRYAKSVKRLRANCAAGKKATK